MNKQKDILFKGMTRPPMIFGIPLMPFVGTLLVGLLLSVWINLKLAVFLIPIFIGMKILTLKDDFIFRLYFLKLKFGKTSNSESFFGAKTINVTGYRKMKNYIPKVSIFGLNQVANFADYLPYSSHISSDIIFTKDFQLLTTFKLDGVSFELEDEMKIEKDKHSIEMLLKSFSSEPVSFYVHSARFDVDDSFTSTFESPILSEIEEKYYKGFEKGSLKNNGLFLTLVFNPLKVRVTSVAFVNSSLESKKDEIKNFIKKMNEYTDRIEKNIKIFKPTKLKIYELEGVKYSSQLEFYNFLISGKWNKVRLLKAPIYEYLTGNLKNLQYNADTIQLNFNNDEKSFSRMIEIKDYNKETFSGILDALMDLKINYTLTQSFSTEKKIEAKDSLQKQRKSLVGVEDDAGSQIEELDQALDELVSGDISFGKYHFSLLIFGSTVQDCRDNTNLAITILNEAGFLVTLANIALPATYFSQFPANFDYRSRISLISSKNFAGLIALHNYPKGKKDRNCWGDAVTIFKTPNRQPYYFNFHITKGNDFGKFYLANTLLVGESGGGKTALMTFLMSQMQKFNNPNTFPDKFPENKKRLTTIYLDKDYGAMGIILSMGGKYITLKNGVSTGFNPLMVENTPTNIKNIQNLIRILVTRNGEIITPLDEQKLNNAILSVMNNFELEERKYGISLILENLTEDLNDTNSLKARLRLWSKNYKFGWVFDNEDNLLDFDKNIVGIDGTNFLDDKEICSPISFFILWRVLEQIDGSRFALFIDELWKWIGSSTEVAQEVKNKLKTIRKENGFIVMGTQSVEDVSASEIGRAIIEQCNNYFLLSNSRANADDYIKGLSCTEKEFQRIKSFNPDQYQFLIKKSKESVVCSLDLSSIGDELIKILSTGTAYVDEIKMIMEDDSINLEERIEKLKTFYLTEDDDEKSAS